MWLLVLVGACVIVGCPVSEAQTPSSGALIGTVTDPSGGVVPDATVTVTSSATGTSRSVKTESTGVYKIPLLSPGAYIVEIKATGFQTYKVPSVMINVTESEELDIALTVGSTSQTVTVQAETVLAQTESTTLGRVVGEQTVDNLPLVTRNYTQILNLYTGVQADVNVAGALGRNSPDIHVNGGRAIDNDYQMDGVHINNFGTAKAGDWLGYTGIAIPNPDSIQEFKVQTSLYDAGYGRSSGANVNVITKSGSNDFHGNVFEYFRNNVFNANDFFLKSTGQPRPILKQNQFGGTFGGPVVKGKLFFFASYQGTRQRNGVGANSLQSAFLPPLTDDRSVANLGQTFCGQTGAEGGVAIACDGSNINPVAVALLNQKLPNGTYVIPTPQVIRSNGEGFSVFSEVSDFTEDQVVYNMDFVVTKNNTLSGRYFWSRDPEIPAFTTSGSNVPGNGGQDNFGNQSLVLKLVSVLSDSLVNTVTVSGIRNTGSLINLQPTTTTEIGMTGTGQTDVLPQMIVTGLFTLGGSNNDFFKTAVTGFSAADQISFVHGKHSFRAGFEIDPIRDNFNLYGNKRGSLTFEGFPDFLLGMSGAQNGSSFSNIFSESAISGITDRQFRVVDYSAYVQDDFKANSQLTFNIGVRWDYYGDVSEARGYITNFVPKLAINPPPAGGTLSGYVIPTNFPKSVLESVGSSAVTNSGNKGCCGDEQNNFWAPRFGLAWRPFARTDRFVVRSGYGIFYSRLAGNDFLQLLLEPPFNALQSFTGVQNTAATLQEPWNPPLPATPFWPVTYPTSEIAAHSVLANSL
ncbi:MAG: carboxypeptidase-like regulatory domain-containing protein, partial [Candidatus Acidiferrales bacterium]